MTRSGAQEGKSERRVIPDRGVEARVPRGEGRAAIEGGAQIVRRVVPIEDRAVGMPSERRCVADGVGQNDCARRGVGGVAESPDGLQVEPAGRLEIEPTRSLALNIALNSQKVRRGRCSQPRLQVHIGVRRRAGDAVARRAAATPAPAPVPGRPATSNPTIGQQRDPDLAVLRVRVGVLFELHDRRDFAVVLAAVEPVAHRLDQPATAWHAAVGVGLEDDLGAGIGAVDALQVDRHLLLPREAFVGQLRDVGHRLADGHQALAERSCCRRRSRRSPTGT